MTFRTTRRQLERTIADMLATAKAVGCQSQACPEPPQELTAAELQRLSLWADGQNVVFVHDSAEGRLYRFPFYPGQGEWVHRDIRDEVEIPSDEGPKAVVLYDAPLAGPQGGQVHFGLVAWEAHDGPDEVQVMAYRRPRA